MINKIKNIKETVRYMLTKYPEARDNDMKLILAIWEKYNPALKEASYLEFGDLFGNGKLPNVESIRRARQLMQENYPSLRGESYKVRQNEQESGVRNNIKKVW